jgi:uncharacterized BrkB/YihY/UPF0761 family membrane protein
VWEIFCPHVGGDKCFTHAAVIARGCFDLSPIVAGRPGIFMEENKTQEQVFSLAARYFPLWAQRLIREDINAIVTAREFLSLLSTASLLWSATFMFDAINAGVNVA